MQSYRRLVTRPLSKKLICLLLFPATAWVLLGCGPKGDIYAERAASAADMNECVVLIHGMGRTSGSMSAMQNKLIAAGYSTVNLDYPSTRKEIAVIAADDFPRAVIACEQLYPEKIHFVTHSLGGIILRQVFAARQPDSLGRVVMLSPPNHGSELVDRIKDWYLFKWLTGPAGQQLSTAADSVPNHLGAVDYPVGVITGNRHAIFDAWFAEIIPGEDDGKVAVNSAKLLGMQDFLVVSESHPFIMDSDYVQMETIHFLREGRFSHNAPIRQAVQGADWFSLSP